MVENKAPDENQEETAKKEKECRSCGKINPEYVQFCINCGKVLSDSNQKQKFCPSCNKNYENRINFCLDCGTKLVKLSSHKEDVSSISDTRNGFTIPLDKKQSQKPISLPTLGSRAPSPMISVLRPSNRSPKKSIPSNSTLFSIKIERQISFDKGIIKGIFTLHNLSSYLFVGIFIYIIYLFWYLLLFQNNFVIEIIDYYLNNGNAPNIPPGLLNELLVAIVAIIVIEIVMFLPFILLSILSTSYGISTRYKIELSQMFVIIGINILLVAFNIPIPFILLPGEIKLQELPPRKKVAKFVSIGVIFGVIIVSLTGIPLVWALIQTNNSGQLAVFNAILNLRHVLLVFITLAWLTLISLLPFNNVISQLVREWNNWVYLIVFIIMISWILMGASLIELYWL